MNTGETVRKIRLIKGLSQKQVYSGIISRSFANRFESGENDIQAGKLFQILDNLAISPNEFQYISNDYQLSPIDSMLAEAGHLYEAQSFSALAHWLHKHQDSNNIQVQIVAGFVELLLVLFGHLNFSLTKNIRVFISHLLGQKNWTLQEIKRVDMLVPVISAHKEFKIKVSTVTARMEKNCAEYLPKYEDKFQISGILINYYGVVLQTYLNNRDYTAAYDFREKFVNLNESLFDWDARVHRQLWLAVWELYFGDFTFGKKTLDRIINFKKIFNTKFDLNIDSVTQVRVKEAQKYRKSVKK